MNKISNLLPKHSGKKRKGIAINPNILMETIRINLPMSHDARHYKLIREASNAFNAYLERYKGYHYGISKGFERLQKDSNGDVKRKDYIVEHAIPVSTLIKQLKEKFKNPCNDQIKDYLTKQYHIYCLTKGEDNRLNKELKDKMPDDWDGKDPLARYKKASTSIKIAYESNQYVE